MKAIKITPANKSAIELALAAANGKAEAHTYSTYSEIEMVAHRANIRLIGLIGALKHSPGAVLNALSGDAVSNAYARKGFSRAGTAIRLDCRATGWFLAAVSRGDVYKDGGYELITLTAEQDVRAVAVLRAGYRIATKGESK